MKILVCTDGSERGQKTMALAAMIALPLQAATTILGISEEEKDEHRLRQTLVRAVEEFQMRGIATEPIVRHGDPVGEIVGRVEELSPDLVIIGADKKKATGPLALSRKAYSIVADIAVPVLLVPAIRLQLKRFLICSGGSSYIDNAVRFAAGLAKGLGATITLLNVAPEVPAMHAGVMERQESAEALLGSSSALGRNLRSEKEILEQAGVSVDVRIRHGIVLEQIFQEIEERDHDLIVVGSFPITRGLRHYMIGNLTRKIVNRSGRPIMVVRSDKKPDSILGFLTRRRKLRP
jgi:nucleotide-binding universal stress UspA family protein